MTKNQGPTVKIAWSSCAYAYICYNVPTLIQFIHISYGLIFEEKKLPYFFKISKVDEMKKMSTFPL